MRSNPALISKRPDWLTEAQQSPSRSELGRKPVASARAQTRDDVSEMRSELVIEHLDRILASDAFCRCERLRSFLTLVVERALQNPAEAIKEYHIATEAYGRPASFDPRSDPIIRVEARRLRAKLKEYYGLQGRNDVLEIVLLSGSYIPIFRAHAPATPCLRIGPSTGLRWFAVEPFHSPDSTEEEGNLNFALTEEVLHALELAGVRLREWRPGWNLANLAAVDWSGERLYAFLQGSASRRGTSIRASVRLIRVEDGAEIWSSVYWRPITGDFAAQKSVASAIATAVRDEATEPRIPKPSLTSKCNPEPLDVYLERRINTDGLTSDEVLQAVEILKKFAQCCRNSNSPAQPADQI